MASDKGGQRRDLTILFATRVTRAVGFGFSAVLLAIYLQARGLSPTQIGAVVAVGLAAASLMGLIAAYATGRLGRRGTLAIVGLLMVICGFGLNLTANQWLLAAVALTGVLGSAGTDLGPFLAVEQALLKETTRAAGRNRAFARYSLSGAVAAAAGGLIAAFGTSVARDELLFLLYGCIGVGTATSAISFTARNRTGC